MVNQGHGDLIEASSCAQCSGIGGFAKTDLLGQHRVETMNGVGEFGKELGINCWINACKARHIGAQLANVTIEGEMLIKHLDPNLGLLEEIFVGDLGGDVGEWISPIKTALGKNSDDAVLLLQLGQDAVVLGEEHLMHSGEADVFVEAAVASDQVLVKGLENKRYVRACDVRLHRGGVIGRVIAFGGENEISRGEPGNIGGSTGGSGRGQAEGCLVVEEGVARGGQDKISYIQATSGREDVVGGEIAILHIHLLAGDLINRHQLGHAVCPEDGQTIGVESHQWSVGHIHVMQDQANIGSVGFDLSPIGHATKQFTVDGNACIGEAARGEVGEGSFEGLVAQTVAPLCFAYVLTQEHGAALIGAVVLAHINRRRNLVEAFGPSRCEGQGVSPLAKSRSQRRDDARGLGRIIDLVDEILGICGEDLNNTIIENQCTFKGKITAWILNSTNCRAQRRPRNKICGVIGSNSQLRQQGIGSANSDRDVDGVGAGASDRFVCPSAVIETVTGEQINFDLAIDTLGKKVEAVAEELAKLA